MQIISVTTSGKVGLRIFANVNGAAYLAALSNKHLFDRAT